jgi:hypothetical protein
MNANLHQLAQSASAELEGLELLRHPMHDSDRKYRLIAGLRDRIITNSDCKDN